MSMLIPLLNAGLNIDCARKINEIRRKNFRTRINSMSKKLHHYFVEISIADYHELAMLVKVSLFYRMHTEYSSAVKVYTQLGSIVIGATSISNSYNYMTPYRWFNEGESAFISKYIDKYLFDQVSRIDDYSKNLITYIPLRAQVPI